MTSLADLAVAVAEIVDAHSFPDDPPVVFRDSTRRVRRLGLVLEPVPALADWVDRERVDALFVHRPWGVLEAELADDIGIVASHAGFDHRLTVGFNPGLARDLGIEPIRAFGEKDGRVIGMIGDAAGSADAWVMRINRVFGGCEGVVKGRPEVIRRVAVVGAMTDALVRQAAENGADLYVTGQIRTPARNAVEETGIHVAAVGHTRSEAYGLWRLACGLRDRFPGLETIVHPSSAIAATDACDGAAEASGSPESTGP